MTAVRLDGGPRKEASAASPAKKPFERLAVNRKSDLNMPSSAVFTGGVMGEKDSPSLRRP